MCYRRRKKHPTNLTSKCNTPENSLMNKNEPPTSSVQQPTGSGGENNNVAAAGKTNDPRIQPIGASNRQPLAPSSTPTPKTQTPKGTSKETERTIPGTVEDTKSKAQSTQSQIIPTAEAPVPQPPPRTPLKGEKKSVVVHKGGGSQRKKPISKRPEESEHFEEGEDKSKEDISVDDTLKGIGTEMPHFET